MTDDMKTFKVENATLIFRNFEGKETMFNDPGDRNFCVILDEDVARVMAEDGWNVKMTKPRDEEDTPVPYIKIKVSFKNKPPLIVMITSGARTRLKAEQLGVLDYADIKIADLICNAYNWSVGGKTGVTPYLKTMFVTIEEDELERKYSSNQIMADVSDD